MIEQEIHEYTDQIWRQALRLEVAPASADAAALQEAVAKEKVTSFVHFMGDTWSGACLIQVPQTLATKLTCALLEMEEGEVDLAMRDDAMGELANMLGGNLKPFLPGDSKLSLPSVSIGEGGSVSIPGTELSTRCWFSCDGEVFSVTLLAKNG